MLTEAGLKRKTYHEIYEEMVAGVSKRLGQDINMSETSPLGMMMQVFAWHLAELWEDVEQVYHESYIQYATGVQLMPWPCSTDCGGSWSRPRTGAFR